VAVVEGHHDDGPFNRAAALNAAAGLAGEWDLAVVADADVVVEPDSVRRAISAAAQTGGGLVFAHDCWLNLSQRDAQDILDGDDLRTVLARGGFTSRTPVVSGVFVVTRGLWDAVGGFDEAFVGYGGEDHAFYRACSLVQAVRHIPGALWHVWHPRPDQAGPWVPRNVARMEQYARAETLVELSWLRS